MRSQTMWQIPLLLGVALQTASTASAPAAPITAPAKIVAPAVVVAPAVIPTAAPVVKSTAPIVKSAAPIDTATLLKQIDDLKGQVARIAKKQREAEEKHETTHKIEDAKMNILQARQTSQWPEGFFDIQGTNSAIKIGGRIKVDGSYSGGQKSGNAGDSMFVRTLPLKGADQKAGKSGHFNGTLQGSRIHLSTITRTAKGDVKGYIETDFGGTPNGPSYTSATGSTSTQYGVRLRHAYVTWEELLVGQTTTNFYDADSFHTFLDNLNVITAPRIAQVRWSQKLVDGLSLHVSAEKPNTDYYDRSAALLDNANAGKSPLPDFTARLRYEGKMGFVSLRGIVRSLQVQTGAGDTYASNTATNIIPNFSSRQTGWGLGLSGQLNTAKKSNIFGMINVGDGLGQIVDDATGQAAYLQLTGSTDSTAMKARFPNRFATTTVVNTVLGYEHWWTEKLRTTIMGTYTKIKNPSFAPILTTSTQLNSTVKRAVANVIYSPVKNIDVGLEVYYGIRKTISGVDTLNGTTYYNHAGNEGKCTEVMTSFIYRF